MASFHVLAVDDDADQAMFLGRAFRKAGFPAALQVVATGTDALDCVAGRGTYADRARFPAPTHLFLDLKLPRIDGLEILDRLRRDGAPVRVAMLTSSLQPADVARAYAAGAELYLIKPLTLERLGVLIAALRPWFEAGARPALPSDLLLPPPAP